MPKEDIPAGADPVFEQVMRAIRTGKNPDHKRLSKLSADKKAAALKALEQHKRRRKERPSTADGYDVIDTGMFD